MRQGPEYSIKLLPFLSILILSTESPERRRMPSVAVDRDDTVDSEGDLGL